MTVRLIAIVLMLCTSAATRADLGRLFFTPAQRATLDNARKQNIRIDVVSDKVQTAAPMPQDVSVNGVVRRSDGKSTVWLNNRPVTGRSESGINVLPKSDSDVRLRIPEGGRDIDLKVGQTVEIVSGTIQEGYSRRPSVKPEAKTPPVAENAATAPQAQSGQPGETAQKQGITQ